MKIFNFVLSISGILIFSSSSFAQVASTEQPVSLALGHGTERAIISASKDISDLPDGATGKAEAFLGNGAVGVRAKMVGYNTIRSVDNSRGGPTKSDPTELKMAWEAHPIDVYAELSNRQSYAVAFPNIGQQLKKTNSDKSLNMSVGVGLGPLAGVALNGLSPELVVNFAFQLNAAVDAERLARERDYAGHRRADPTDLAPSTVLPAAR